jgi:hypothetical protein
VITHHVVLQSLLQGRLSPEDAVTQGLLVFADGDASPVEQLFALGLDQTS